ncbi:MAG: rhodanese-like domain-containing protein [Myxococcales bacterium]|nr:rhodanese-like domain-containing protein [Myxococcales bacterium]
MRWFLGISLLVLAAATGCGCGCGCAKHSEDLAGDRAAPVSTVSTVSVDQLDQLLAAHTSRAVDANTELTRRKMGVIPGAVLLRDFESIDNLPADKAQGLVFYCANTWCEASHQAAAKAIVAGYTRVQVLPDGIAGWVKAGKPITSIQ